MADVSYLAILATSAATAGAAQFALVLKDRWVQGREGKFSSLHAALFFEEYARQCSHILGEKEDYANSSGHAGTDHGAIPSMPAFPADIEWRKVGIKLTQQAFGLRVSVEAMNSDISDRFAFDPPDGGDWTMLRGCVSIGLEAIELAKSIREKARLDPAPVPDPHYTTERHLTEAKERFEEIKRRVGDGPSPPI